MSLNHIEIECISTELCQNCPELNINVDSSLIYSGVDIVTYHNSVRCTHYRKCMRMLDYLEKRMTNKLTKDISEKNDKKSVDPLDPLCKYSVPHLDKDGCVYWDKLIKNPLGDDTE